MTDLPESKPGPLDLVTAKQLVRDACIGLEGTEIAFLGDGCDHDNYIVDGQYVLRVPKNEGNAATLPIEVLFLCELPDLGVSIPRPIGVIRSSVSPFPYTMYPYLEGVEGDIARNVDLTSAAKVLGRMLGELHQFPVNHALRIGLKIPSVCGAP